MTIGERETALFLCILLPNLLRRAEEYGEEREEKHRDSAGKSDGAERAVAREHRYDACDDRGDEQHSENEEQPRQDSFHASLLKRQIVICGNLFKPRCPDIARHKDRRLVLIGSHRIIFALHKAYFLRNHFRRIPLSAVARRP